MQMNQWIQSILCYLLSQEEAREVIEFAWAEWIWREEGAGKSKSCHVLLLLLLLSSSIPTFLLSGLVSRKKVKTCFSWLYTGFASFKDFLFPPCSSLQKVVEPAVHQLCTICKSYDYVFFGELTQKRRNMNTTFFICCWKLFAAFVFPALACTSDGHVSAAKWTWESKKVYYKRQK